MTTPRFLLDRARSYTEALLPNGERITANSRSALKGRYLNRLTELGTPPLNLNKDFEEAVCAALSPQRQALECRYCDEEQTPAEFKKERVIRLDDVFRFIGKMKDWVTAGAGFVEQAEAERRAAICAQCPRNIMVPGCLGCAGVLGSVLSLLGGKGTRVDGELQSCEICGCFNQAAVHFPMSAQSTELEYPEWCWKNGQS